MLGYILLAYVGMQIHAPFWYWLVLMIGVVSEIGFFINFAAEEDEEDAWER